MSLPPRLFSVAEATALAGYWVQLAVYLAHGASSGEWSLTDQTIGAMTGFLTIHFVVFLAKADTQALARAEPAP